MYLNRNENQNYDIINKNIHNEIESIYPKNIISANIFVNNGNSKRCVGNNCKEFQECINDNCVNDREIKKFRGHPYLLTRYGILFMFLFAVFLVIIFVMVLKLTNKHNKNEKIKYQREISNASKMEYSNKKDEFDSSNNRSLFIQSLKKSEHNSLNQDNDDIYQKNVIDNNYKPNDPYTTYNNKKEYDNESNIYPKTPQSASTLINKSYGSTNNLIEKARFSVRNSIPYNYRKNSVGAVSTPIEPTYNNNFSYHDFNTTNSCIYVSPFENRYFIPQFNTYNSVINSVINSPIASPNSYNQSISLPMKSSIYVESQLQSSIHEGPASSCHYPTEMDIEEESDEDNHTTLSFDDGVLKVQLTNSNSFKKSNKGSVVYSYSEVLDTSNECIIPSPKPSASKSAIK